MERVFYDAPRKNKCPKCGNADIQGDIIPAKNANKSRFLSAIQNTGKAKNSYEILAKCPVCGENWILVPIRASFKIPFTQSGRDAMANDLLVECNVCAAKVSTADHLSDFFHYWEKLMFELERLCAFEGLVEFTREMPSAYKNRLISEFQEKLRAAISRNKERVLSTIKDDPIHLSAEADEFISVTRKHMTRFSEDTLSFARKANDEILCALKERPRERPEKGDNSEEAQELLWSIVIDVPKMNKTRDVVTFVELYDKILQALQRLVLMGAKPVQMREPPAHAYNRLKKEFQKHLSAAIDRSAGQVIENINGKYRGLESMQKKEADYFFQSLIDVSGYFSESTALFAQEAKREVLASLERERDRQIFDVSCPQKKNNYSNGGASKPAVDWDRIVREEKEWLRQQMGKTPIEAELDRIDSMDGHTFEQWCARLLKASGLVDVEVTRGSGDQGVDVIATLDGVRYAVQCKCYSSDLGNKPVQEVFAGAVIYKCQVGCVMTNRHFTTGAKELAAATGVALWDRDWIISLLEQLDPNLFPLYC